MTRLIDAWKLREYANNLKGKCVDAIDIMRFPAEDAVPVIRCKDCKWQGDDEHCPVCNSCGRGSLPSGDWFCRDGERKES